MSEAHPSGSPKSPPMGLSSAGSVSVPSDPSEPSSDSKNGEKWNTEINSAPNEEENSSADQSYERYDGSPDEGALRELARKISSSSTNEAKEILFPSDDDSQFDPNSPDFDVSAWASRMHRIYHSDTDRFPQRELGWSFRNLHAYGFSQDVNYQLTTGNLPLAVVEKGISWIKRQFQGDPEKSGDASSIVNILQPMDGLIRPGELVVVLGRPGAGCSTFLRSAAAQTYGFSLSKDTQVNYMGLTEKQISHQFRGDVTYCAESELHFPTLSVGDTLMFASRCKTPDNRLPGISREEYAKYMRDVYMAMFGLSHTVNTKVGSDMIRGVSGGERKRVSIAELAIAGAALQCWDNSTRGLDAATALEFIRTLRTSAVNFSSTSLVAIYQASEEMYELFDKAQVLYEGYQIYYGPIDKARDFFYNMGWQPKPRQSTPDFLTSLSQPNEREPREGYEHRVPRTPKEFNDLWKQSDIYRELISEVEQFNQEHPVGGQDAQNFEIAYRMRQDKKLPKNAAYTVGWVQQAKALVIRGFQRMKGDPTMPATVVFGNTILSFIISSMFYNLKGDTESFYHRTAVLFFGLLFNAFSAQLEIFALFEARNIVQKHHQYAFYHPAIDALASVITEFPVKVLNCIFFNTILYFITNLRREAGNYFFFLLCNFVTTLYMSFFFRTIGGATPTIQIAMIPAQIVLLAMVMFTGFVIPVTNLKGTWCRWINYIDPLAYSYEALMTNEFHNREYLCSDVIPYTPKQGATGQGYVCATSGAIPGQLVVLGDNYMNTAYEYRYTHQWRNIGIIFGFMFFLLFTYMLIVYLNPGMRTKGEVLIYPRKYLRQMLRQQRRRDEETGKSSESSLYGADEKGSEETQGLIEASNDIFYWKDVCYDVKIKTETRRILNYVDGWVKPGTLTALMGASGAGKTTLLDTLANRVTMGVVYGHMFVNGIPRDQSFQRTTGYAMQQDLHMASSTVREALEFAAILRQPYSVPLAEKKAYVDNVLKILEMESYQHAVVGVPGMGLNVEQRKRLTIGVELAGKPKLLLFLDEPTSGLDSQTAWSVCQLMKKLSNAGQAILCTIHQPSALLLQQFDRLLFLARGGRTVYFGPIGENSATLTGYFEKYGADPCPPDANPAEWMLSVIGAAPGSKANQDYAKVWLHSEERRAVRHEINGLMTKFNASADNKSPQADNREYASPFWLQFSVVLKRVMQNYWRTPLYIWAKLGLNVVAAIFNGFTFWYSDTSLQGMQNLMFSIFMFTICLTSIVQQYLPSFVESRNLYEARERPSKIFSWQTFILTMLTAEVPWQTLGAAASFFAWYYPAHLFKNASQAHQTIERGGMTFFYVWLFFLYAITFGQLLVAPMEDADAAANIAIMLFTTSLMFAGVLTTKDAMPGFWKFMYRVSPMNYWIGGMLVLAIAHTPVRCADYEFVKVRPPSGQTCTEYFKKFLDVAPGYLGELDRDDGWCRYCSLNSTDQFLESVNLSYHLRWRNLGLFIAYIVVNVFGCIFLYWLARVPKSSSRVQPSPVNTDDNDDPALEAANQEPHKITSRMSRISSRVSRIATRTDSHHHDEQPTQ